MTDQNEEGCWQGSVRPKNTFEKIPISWTTDLILISVDSPECPLSDEVHTGFLSEIGT